MQRRSPWSQCILRSAPPKLNCFLCLRLVFFPAASLLVTCLQSWTLYLVTHIYLLRCLCMLHDLLTIILWHFRWPSGSDYLQNYLTMYCYAFLPLLFYSLGLQALATQVRWELSPTTSSYSLPWIHCLPSLWCFRQLPTISTVYSQAETPVRKQSTDTTGCYFCFLGCLLLLSQF